LTLSLDIGGTNIRSALVSKTIMKKYKKTPTPKTKTQILNSLFQIIKSYPKQTICISTAGLEKNDKIVQAINMDFDNVPLKSILQKKFPRQKVYIENDGSCAALAELHYGAAKPYTNSILLTLGTGIGGGIIIDKKLYTGNGGAGEIGSMRIQDEIIFEHFASGNASLTIAIKHGFKKTTSRELEELAKKGNKKAISTYNEVGHNLGIGLANLAYIFDPDCIIIGGGFSRVKFVYPSAIKTLNSLYKLSPKPKIIRAKFGDDAGLIGAALLPKLS
jgi:glucokinase